MSVTSALAQAPLPSLTEPVNDFANVVDAESEAELARMIRGLQAASGDVVVVATAETIEPYGDVREYAVKLFANNGRGIGDRDKDNGLLILVAIRERRVWVEVGYGLEQWITDGFAGETSRAVMTPEFREGRYGRGLVLGTARIIGRIAQGRNVQIEGVEAPSRPARNRVRVSNEGWIVLLFIIIFLLSRGGRGPRSGVRRWGSGGWSGWSSGVGPFGGGFGGRGFGGGGFRGGGGFGGGFGGFGGGRSGGGGGGGSW